MQRSLIFADLTGDLRISLRGLRRSPLLTLAIVATVGLGIGATTVIFSGMNAALLRPLPYRDSRAARLDLHRCCSEQVPLLIGRLPRARGAADAFRADCRIYRPGHGLQRRRRRGAPVGTSRVVDVLAAPRDQARIGRPFAAADGRPGSPPVVIVSHGFWQRRLAGPPTSWARPFG